MTELVVGIVVLLVSIAGVIVGIVYRGFWRDRGLMKRNGHTLRWDLDDLPIQIMHHQDLSFVWAATCRGAAKRFNVATNLELFNTHLHPAPPDYEPKRPPPKGFVFLREGAEEGRAFTNHRYDIATGTIWSARVTVCSDQNVLRMATLIHELGHVLGLDHDESPSSIMYPILDSRRAPGELSEENVELLKKTYTREGESGG